MKKDKILINIENLSDIEEYKKIGINNFLFAVDNFSIGYKTFDINSLINIKENKYLLINKIFNTEDINEFKKMIPLLNKFNGIIFEDIGVYHLLKDTNINLIWNQSHFATNYSSINYWLDLTNSAVISNELTKEEVKEIIDKSNKKVILNVFGKNNIMYSRRTLLTNFNKYFKLKTNKEIILKENISNCEFRMLENESGTFTFDNNYFNIIDYIKYFNDNNILFYLIYPFGLSTLEIKDIIENNSTIKYNDGFMNKKTIYKLGDK